MLARAFRGSSKRFARRKCEVGESLQVIPSLTCGPKEIFSWAGRAAFFGGMMNCVVELTISLKKASWAGFL
jgi:hypothetical protein